MRDLREILNESSSSTFLDDKTSYEYIYDAVCEFVRRTNTLTSTQTIATIASQRAYDLNTDYLELYLKDDYGRLYIKYNDGSTNYFPYWKNYEDIIGDDLTNTVTIPDRFCIIDDTSPSNFTGTTTSAGAATNGECTLTNTGTDFSNVSVGDLVHNVSDSSDGYVLSKTSTTALVTALFDGTNNAWASGNSYVIVPSMRYQLILEPLPSTGGHTITMY